MFIKHITCIWLGFTKTNSVYHTGQKDKNDMYVHLLFQKMKYLVEFVHIIVRNHYINPDI